jgi:hypothetical protein
MTSLTHNQSLTLHILANGLEASIHIINLIYCIVQYSSEGLKAHRLLGAVSLLFICSNLLDIFFLGFENLVVCKGAGLFLFAFGILAYYFVLMQRLLIFQWKFIFLKYLVPVLFLVAVLLNVGTAVVGVMVYVVDMSLADTWLPLTMLSLIYNFLSNITTNFFISRTVSKATFSVQGLDSRKPDFEPDTQDKSTSETNQDPGARMASRWISCIFFTSFVLALIGFLCYSQKHSDNPLRVGWALVISQLVFGLHFSLEIAYQHFLAQFVRLTKSTTAHSIDTKEGC